MLTVKRLVAELGLELAAGEFAADAPVRSVHSSELLNPTPWLSGGELLLSTGMALHDAPAERELVARLSDHGIAGLGFGTGFNHAAIPVALLSEAHEREFPVFEVPYELPFIAITERAFTDLAGEQVRVLQRSIAIHARLERLVLDDRGLDQLIGAVAAAAGASVWLLSPRGETLAACPGDSARDATAGASHEGALRDAVVARRAGLDPHPPGPRPPGARPLGAPGATAFEPVLGGVPGGHALVVPVAARERAAPQAWLACVRTGTPLEEADRLTLHQAVTAVALELMRRRVQRETERRLAGDVLAEALGGRLPFEELSNRLAPFGVGERCCVLVFGVEDPGSAEAALDRALAAADVPALVATRASLLCAVLDGSVLDAPDDVPVALATHLRDELEAECGFRVRVAASRVGRTELLRRSYHEARCALEAARIGSSDGADGSREVATHRDLGSLALLLALHDDDALRVYSDNVLGPIEAGANGYGEELLRSLEAFIEHNGQWERAARQLYCHRHTLRYRVKRVEELTGRSLARAQDRIELWLALRARELVS